MTNNSRRNFLKKTALSTAAITIGSSTLAVLLPACSPAKQISNNKFSTGHLQQPLPYVYNALEDVIDAKTMEIHYSKHAAGYSKALIEAVKDAGLTEKVSTEQILQKISNYNTKMRNNAGGHYNHEMFWQSMRPKTDNNQPSGKLIVAINNSFGSFNNFKTLFTEAATKRFGSGWAWLSVDANKKLIISSTPNQDNPLMDVSDSIGFPVLGIDVWEHAYYLKYQNKRADYINNWWAVVNWDYIEKRYESAI
ncbi:MAG: superoxide dismutase [Ferruginibacter sp.]